MSALGCSLDRAEFDQPAAAHHPVIRDGPQRDIQSMRNRDDALADERNRIMEQNWILHQIVWSESYEEFPLNIERGLFQASDVQRPDSTNQSL
jgi:hypothetical protein